MWKPSDIDEVCSRRLAGLLAAAAVTVLACLAPACAGPDPTYVGTGGGGGSSLGGGGAGDSGGGGCVPDDCPAVDGARRICEADACSYACDAPRQDCNQKPDDGCEADTTSDAAHCGGCNSPCPLGCIEGACNAVVAISAGLANACAVMLDGSVWCWGHNAYGEHGDEGSTQHDAPVKVPLSGAAASVSVGGKVGTGHVCAVMVDGTVQCWGDGNMNGNPSVDGVASPPATVVGLVNAAQVSAGGRHTCARQEDGDLFCWGANFNGELGNGQVLNGYEDEGAIEVLGDAVDVSAGDDHTCALINSGEVLCWGDNSFAQLGTGDGQDSSVPVGVLSGADEVAVGTRSSCARIGSEVHCWGRDLNGAVGEGSCALLVETPTLVTVPEPLSIAVGSESAAAITGSEAEVVAWGSGPHPDGSPGSCLPENKGFPGVALLDLGGAAGCAVMATGSAMCWGDDQNGAVGDGPGGGTKPAVEVAFPPP